MRFVSLSAALLLMVVSVAALAQSPHTAHAGAPQAAAQLELGPGGFAAPSVRIRDIARVQSVRPNQLAGYGLVVGLNGTGDSQQVPFTIQSIVNMLRRFGVTVDMSTVQTKNAAAVMVSADVPAFYKNGSRLDVTVSSLGDAKSLQGGTLLQTPLLGADDAVYAAAQGPVTLGGFSASSGGSGVAKNHPTTGLVTGGALIEKEIPTTLTSSDGTIRINLADPDFSNATSIAAAINGSLGAGAAAAEDAATIVVHPTADYRDDAVRFISVIGDLTIQPSTPARVVLNERTGIVVIGGGVRIAPIAVAQGSLSVEIQSDAQVSQPGPLALTGKTVVVPKTTVNAKEDGGPLTVLRTGATLAELVRALNALRVTPRDMVAIIQAIKAAGALYAELDVQ